MTGQIKQAALVRAEYCKTSGLKEKYITHYYRAAGGYFISLFLIRCGYEVSF